MNKKTYIYDRKQAVNKDDVRNTYGNSLSNTSWLRYYKQLNGTANTGSDDTAGAADIVKAEETATVTPSDAQGVVAAADTGKKSSLSYADYLTKYGLDEKKADMTYADYLERYGLSETSSGAMSYADYLARTGTDTEKDYQRTVREAETDYAKARAGYGSTGETLARASMNASGYSDYITGAGFAAMQNAKVAAADTKALADATNAASYADYVEAKESAAESYNSALKQSYANYLMNEEAEAESYNSTLKQSYANYLMNEEATQQSADQTIGSYVNSLAADGADEATIRARVEAYAKAMGYSLPTTLDDMISSSLTAYAVKTPSEAAAEAETTESETASLRAGALEIVNAGTENALSGQQIRQQLSQAGYSDELIDSVMSDYSDRVWLSLKQNIDRASTIDDLYPESGIGYSDKNVDTWVREGEISAEQGAQLKSELAEKRISALNTALDNSMSDDDTLTVINQIVTLNRAGDISDDDVRDLMSRVGSESVQAVIDKSQKSYKGDDKIGEPVVELLDQYNDVGENEDYYTKAGAEAIREQIAESMNVSVAKSTRNTLKMVVSVSNNDTGSSTSETFEFTGTLKVYSSGQHGIEYGEAPWPDQIEKDGFYTYADKLYAVQNGDIYLINGIYKNNAGSQQNADALMEILKSKATVID